MLSLIPPSIETYRRVAPPSSSTSLMVPTSYTVTVPGPTMARPGSTATAGAGRPASWHSRLTISVSDLAIASTGGGSSLGR